MKTALQILKAARAKLTPPGSWTQGFYALDATGEMAWPTASDACRFCARGAIMAVADTDDPEGFSVAQAVERLRRHAKHRGITRFNDSSKTTHAMVLRWFDRAIAAEEAASQTKVRV